MARELIGPPVELSIGPFFGVIYGGERFGLIRFGSRTDLFLPDGVAPLVAVGQCAVGGETVVADLGSDEDRRGAEER